MTKSTNNKDDNNSTGPVGFSYAIPDAVLEAVSEYEFSPPEVKPALLNEVAELLSVLAPTRIACVSAPGDYDSEDDLVRDEEEPNFTLASFFADALKAFGEPVVETGDRRDLHAGRKSLGPVVCRARRLDIGAEHGADIVVKHLSGRRFRVSKCRDDALHRVNFSCHMPKHERETSRSGETEIKPQKPTERAKLKFDNQDAQRIMADYLLNKGAKQSLHYSDIIDQKEDMMTKTSAHGGVTVSCRVYGMDTPKAWVIAAHDPTNKDCSATLHSMLKTTLKDCEQHRGAHVTVDVAFVPGEDINGHLSTIRRALDDVGVYRYSTTEVQRHGHLKTLEEGYFLIGGGRVTLHAKGTFVARRPVSSAGELLTDRDLGGQANMKDKDRLASALSAANNPPAGITSAATGTTTSGVGVVGPYVFEHAALKTEPNRHHDQLKSAKAAWRSQREEHLMAAVGKALDALAEAQAAPYAQTKAAMAKVGYILQDAVRGPEITCRVVDTLNGVVPWPVGTLCSAIGNQHGVLKVRTAYNDVVKDFSQQVFDRAFKEEQR